MIVITSDNQYNIEIDKTYLTDQAKYRLNETSKIEKVLTKK